MSRFCKFVGGSHLLPDATPGEWAEISDALENAPLIYELDIVRTEKTENERLKEKIAREGITVFPQQR